MLREQLNAALKEALKEEDSIRISTIRLVLAAVKDRDIAARGKDEDTEVDDVELMNLLQSMVKQRRQSAVIYEEGGREDLAEAEKKEIEVINAFLPAPMDDKEIARCVQEVIESTGAEKLKDMGRVMGELRKRYSGRMDFSKASTVAREILS